MLQIAATADDNEPSFLDSGAHWAKNCSLCHDFTFFKQTSDTLVTTLRVTLRLMTDLLAKSCYKFVLTSRFKCDPVERHFSKYRHISGERFLARFGEVDESEKEINVN